jgi:hypothetical protein
MLGCRGLLGIEDPIVGGDGGPDGSAACTGDDFDGDGRPDSCDPCPMYKDATADLDTDGDGVGNGCDPDPQVKGDKRVLWTHFATVSDTAAWAVLGGSWIVKAGRLQQTDAAATARITLPGTYSTVQIATEIEILSRGTSPYAGACGYVAGNTFKCCDVREETVGVVELMAWNQIAMSVTDWTGGLAPNTSFELRNAARDGDHDCFVQRGTADTKVQLISTQATGNIVLHTRQAAVAYRYLFVVQMPQ